MIRCDEEVLWMDGLNHYLVQLYMYRHFPILEKNKPPTIGTQSDPSEWRTPAFWLREIDGMLLIVPRLKTGWTPEAQHKSLKEMWNMTVN